MNPSDFRAEARNKLAGKWGKAVLITFLYCIVLFALGFILGLLRIPDSLQSLISTILEVPLVFGIIASFIKVFNGEDCGAFDFFTLGFSNFGKAWLISLYTIWKLILPIIAMIISYILIAVGAVGAATSAMFSTSTASAGGFGAVGIIGVLLLIASMIWIIPKSFYYALSVIIGAANPNISATEAVNTSRELMTGNRAKYFVLQLTFIGWAILASLTLGIGFFWLLPYMMFAQIAFYYYLSGNSSSRGNNVVTENNENIEASSEVSDNPFKTDSTNTIDNNSTITENDTNNNDV